MLAGVGLCVLLLTRVTLGLEDGWMAKITVNIYGMPWRPADNLSSKNSVKFKEAEQTICGIMNNIFWTEPIAGNPVKERYHKCFIDNFRLTNRHVDAPVSFTYSLVFAGPDPVPKLIIDGLFTASMDTYHIGGKVWTLFGDTWLVNRERFEFVRVNMSGYPLKKEENKQNTKTDIAETIEYRVNIANVTWTPELRVQTSPEYLDLTSGFCSALDTLLLPRHLVYKGCSVISIFENSVDGSTQLIFDLTFGQEVNETIGLVAASMILETATREFVGSELALSIGSVLVLEDSLQPTSKRMIIKHKPDAPNDIAETIEYRVNIANVTWTPELRIQTSPEYLDLTSRFCSALDTLLLPRHLVYKGCSVISIFENSVDGSTQLIFDLTFGQEVNETIGLVAASMILEMATRELVGSELALSIGSVLVLEDSLQPTSKRMIIKHKPDAPNVNVCSQKTNVILADLPNKADYIICYKNQAYRFSCNTPNTFDANKKKCTNGV